MEADAMALAESMRRTLRPGPLVPGHAIQHDEDHLAFVIDQALIVCRPSEFYCLRTLLEQANQCVPFAQLAAYLPETGDQAEGLQAKRRRMRRLMTRLRTYLSSVGIEIVNVRLMGYLLVLPTPDEQKSTNR